jgi:preprotein translocase subunit SecD
MSPWKSIAAFLIILASLYFSLPSFIPSTLGLPIFYDKTINLGLDLRGGASLLLELDFEHYERENTSRNVDFIRNELRKEKLSIVAVNQNKNDIVVEFNNKEDIDKAKTVIKKLFGLNMSFIATDYKLSFHFDEDFLHQIRNNLISQSIEIIRKRVDENATKEIDLIRQGDRHILLQVPGIEDPQQLKNLIGKTAKLSFHIVEPNITSDDVLSGKSGVGYKVLPLQTNDNQKRLIVVHSKSLLSGEMLTDAQASVNNFSQPVVTFKFNTTGARMFAEVTKANTGKMLAIVLDNKVLTAPMINEPILGGSGIISGSFTIQSANELALLLRAGALPVPIKIAEERTVGPSLGLDSITSGSFAAMIGTLGILLFMFLFYGLFGLIADLALIVNLVMLVAIMVLIGATLTLPGIAGIVLTLGMAVDANVLIYERIREEIRKGRSPLSAIETGFRTAYTTILDSNLTTILAAIVLYIFGNGPVKGFGVAIIIGICCSMFTALTLSRILIINWYKKYKPTHLPL